MGSVVMTRRINDKIASSTRFAKEIITALKRYAICDWGDLIDCDIQLNDNAVKKGQDKILAAYKTSQGKVYMITEWDGSVTTLLFADEY
jgi:hypothetical protein